MSDILIKGMEMPTDNTVLLRIFPTSENGECYTQQIDIDGDILAELWAVPVPAHGDLIDKKEEQQSLLWIPVAERLPEEWKSVLTYQPYVGDEDKPLIRVSWYIGAGSWRECEQVNKLELPVTHWMPLPQPPKEET